MDPTPDERPPELTNGPVPAYEAPDPERAASAAPTERILEHESIVGRQTHDPYAAWRSPGYAMFALGSMVAAIGHQIAGVAVGWQIYELTGSAMALAWLGLVQAIPVIVLALPAGQIADWFDRRSIVMTSLVLQGVCALGLAMLPYARWSIPYMYLLLGTMATVLSIGRPARNALMPQIVSLRAFSNAAMWNSSLGQISSVVGPALGGLILLGSVRFAYVIDGIVAILFGLLVLRVPLHPESRHISRRRQPPTFRGLLAGVHFVWNTRIILATITLDLFAVLLGGATYLLPVFATDILHVGKLGFGVLRSAPAAGAFVMALLQAHLPPMKRAGPNLLWAVAGFGLATILFGLSHWFWLSVFALFLTGLFDNISVVIRHTLVQVLTPDSMRGRVSAVNQVFIGSSNELGGMRAGSMAAWLGAVTSVVIGGIGTIFVVGAVALLWPQVRRFGSLQDARPLPEPGEARGFEVIVNAPLSQRND
jgi:MFS family permease